MHLLMVSHTSNPWTRHYARFFSERGDDVLVASMTPDPIDAGRVEFIGVEPFRKYGNKHLYVTRVPRLRRIAKRFRPDVVFAPYISSNGLMASLAWKGPLVVSGLGSDVLVGTRGYGARPFLRRQIVRYVCRCADAVHVVSANIERTLCGFGVQAEKINRFPLGIDVERFVPRNVDSRDVANRLICIRKHEPIYDIPTILRALDKLNAKNLDFHCTFVGGGHLIEEHRRLAEELGLRGKVAIVGNASHDELPRYLQRADVYISAALSDGASSALFEAMACGLFLVATDIDANRPWIRDGTSGFLFRPGDATTLADALERALTEQKVLREAAAMNRDLVLRECDQRKNDRRLASLLEKVAGIPASHSTSAEPVQ